MRYSYLIVAICLLPSIAMAASLEQWNVDIHIGNDLVSNVNITFVYNETVSKSDYFITHSVQNINVYVNGNKASCVQNQKPLGILVICEQPGIKNITYSFESYDFVSSSDKFQIFEYKMPLVNPADKLNVRAVLPVGSVIISEDELQGTGLKRFFPVNGVSGSDGRNIFVEWDFKEPMLGNTYTFSVIYEASSPVDLGWVLGILIAAVVVLVVMIVYPRRRRKDVLSVLDENEKKVMKILFDKKKVDQRELVKALGVSKSKISRIVKNLEDRGLVKREDSGRTKKIRLAKQKGEKNE